MLTYRQDGKKESEKMAKKVIKNAISIIPVMETGQIICNVMGEEALMKINAGEILTNSDLKMRFYLSMNNSSIIEFNDDKIVSFKTLNFDNIQE